MQLKTRAFEKKIHTFIKMHTSTLPINISKNVFLNAIPNLKQKLFEIVMIFQTIREKKIQTIKNATLDFGQTENETKTVKNTKLLKYAFLKLFQKKKNCLTQSMKKEKKPNQIT